MVKIDTEVVWARNPQRILPPASLTKIMTALLVLEKQNSLGTIVTVSRTAARASGTRIGLKAGERLRLGDLLAATVMRSANDACQALAHHVAGSSRRFVALMNRRAQQWGLKHTRFVNPCGHDDKGHYSNAHDLLQLAEKALAEPVYVNLMGQSNARITTVDQQRSFEFDNSNLLLGRFPGASGIKTGYTPAAGKCLIALAERDGVRVILVLLNAPDRWWTADAMLEQAFTLARIQRTEDRRQ